MSSAQLAALKGKERIYASLANGALLVHPYKHPQFRSKKVKGNIKSPVVPGNIVEELLCEECTIFINWMRLNKCISRQNSGYVTKCNCREDIRDEDVYSASVVMSNFFTMSQRGRDVRIQDQICRGKLIKKYPRYLKLGNKRVRKGEDRMNGKLFTLCYTKRDGKHSGQVFELRCCLHTFIMFYNISYGRFKQIERDLKANQLDTPVHKLTGEPSNHGTKEYKLDSMRIFFSALEKEAEPHATKVVRTKTGIALRDDDDTIDLPSSYSKRGLYCKLMHLWGWNCKVDGRGSFGKRCNYEARSYDEFWVEGVDEAIYPISYSTFHCFWDLHYPKLKIRSPSYDTCSLCFKYTCSLSSIQREANNASVVLNDIVYTNVEDDNGNNEGEEVDDILINFSKQSENESSSCSSTKDREDEKDEEASIEIQESSSESDDHSSDSESDDGKHLNLKHEKLVLEMSEHCKMWKMQREYVKEKKMRQ